MRVFTIAAVLILACLFGQEPRERRSGRIVLTLTSAEIPDLSLTDQNGKKVKFYSDLIKGKVVLIHGFFTECTAICPMQARALVKLKDRLGHRLGRDVFIVSVSKDPRVDTPEKLRQWGKEYGVNAGWTLLTGEVADVRKVLRDVVTEDLGTDMHESLVVIGNDRSGVWTTTYGLQHTEEIVKVIDKVANGEVIQP
ncbi:MAG TPA: SCO family protein [Pyrinomonadaceae bacterium]|nr:SCO family protein [Pyrinomonadaceae bacterium]